MQNKPWLINGNPRGRALALEDFNATEVDLRGSGADEAQVKVEYLGYDSAMKGQLENVSGYASGNEVGNVMPGSGVDEVVASNSAKLPVGSKVLGRLDLWWADCI